MRSLTLSTEGVSWESRNWSDGRSWNGIFGRWKYKFIQYAHGAIEAGDRGRWSSSNRKIEKDLGFPPLIIVTADVYSNLTMRQELCWTLTFSIQYSPVLSTYDPLYWWRKCKAEATNIYAIQRKKASTNPECRMCSAGEQEFDNGFQEGKCTPDHSQRQSLGTWSPSWHFPILMFVN